MAKAEIKESLVRVPRMDLPATTPEVYQAMVAFTVAAEGDLDPVVAQLVKVRASQMNGCAFCLQMHTMIACAMGESDQRLSALQAWADTAFFTDRERAALALTEAVTFVADGHVPDEVYEAAEQHFDQVELAHLLWTIVAINAWSRLGISTRMAADP